MLACGVATVYTSDPSAGQDTMAASPAVTARRPHATAMAPIAEYERLGVRLTRVPDRAQISHSCAALHLHASRVLHL
jgi:hypothetical protein